MEEYVGLNSVVKFFIKEDNETLKLTIVNTIEKNSETEISKDSPLGQALFGFKVGDKNFVNCESPYNIEILEIENPVFENPKNVQEIKKITKSNNIKIIEPYGKFYETTLSGYCEYLYDRKYSTFTEKGTESTIISYSRAIVKVIEKEDVSFEEFVDKINVYVRKYDFGGECEEFGETGNGTWRNAIKRFKEFIDYQKMSLYQSNTNAPYERKIFWKKYNEYLTKNNNPFTISVGEQWAVVNRNTAAWGKPCITMDFKYREKCLVVNVFIYNDLKLYNLLLKNREYLDTGFEPKPVWCDGLKGENTKRIKIEIPFVDYNVDEYDEVIKKSIPYVLKFIEKYKPYIEC